MLILMFLLFLFKAKAQPSVDIRFSFRFFNKGEAIALEKFCDDYKIMQLSRVIDYCNDAYIPKQSFYDERSKMISLSSGTPYASLDLSIIKGVDTMVIYVINSGYGAIISIDSLAFKPGLFAIECDSRIVNGKTSQRLPELHLNTIDHTSAKVKYYNYWLNKYKELLKSKFYANDKDMARPFRNVQAIYKISKDDLTEKTAKQLGD